MSLVPIILLAAAVLAAAIVLLRLPRTHWAVVGAALLFGLTGYTLQGSPGYAGAPASARPAPMRVDGIALVEARRAMFDPEQPPWRFVTVSDGFTRRGQMQIAANMARNALNDDPNDVEAWLALGNALVEHSEGQLTPAAEFAYDQALKVAPAHPGASFFRGVALLRSGQPVKAREEWAALLERAPAGAPWRAELAQRIAVLDALMARSETAPR